MGNSVEGTRSISDYGRFAALLSLGRCARLPYDEVLFEIGGCAIAPTLGSILPNWLLVIPRSPAANFSQWRNEKGGEPHRLMAEIFDELGIDHSRSIWFEHGPTRSGSPIACGVDHAHLHVIIDPPFSFNSFIAAAMVASHTTWREKPVQQLYGSITDAASYLLAASADRSILTEVTEQVGSQFFRRIIAGLVGQHGAWNYTTHHHIENVWKTLEAFGSQSVRHVSR